jgi:hypothetical protein
VRIPVGAALLEEIPSGGVVYSLALDMDSTA